MRCSISSSNSFSILRWKLAGMQSMCDQPISGCCSRKFSTLWKRNDKSMISFCNLFIVFLSVNYCVLVFSALSSLLWLSLLVRKECLIVVSLIDARLTLPRARLLFFQQSFISLLLHWSNSLSARLSARAINNQV